MMISDTLKVSLVAPTGDTVVVEHVLTGQRWVFGMEDAPKVIRLLHDALMARAPGITVTTGLKTMDIPIDTFVFLASNLGFFLALEWKESEAGIKVVSVPEFVQTNHLPVTLLRPDGQVFN